MSWSRLMIQQNAKKWLHQIIANKNLYSPFMMNYKGRKQGAKEFGHLIQICHKTILYFKDFEGCFALATKTTLFHQHCIISASILFFKLTKFLTVGGEKGERGERVREERKE